MADSSETRHRLNEAYANLGGPRAVFSSKVTDYVASRPDYPPALIQALGESAGITADSLVVDVGAGTGLLTRGILSLGCRVVAVEPNADMRRAADSALGSEKRYESRAGGAEELPLESGCADLITAAQAFHWFEVDKVRVEFPRVLKPAGRVALIWNDRVWDDPLHVALDEVFAAFGGARRGALVAHEDRSNVVRFFGAGHEQQLSWPHEHFLDEAGLVSLALSRSYMPARDSDEGKAVLRSVRSIFERFATAGRVRVPYRTILRFGRPA